MTTFLVLGLVWLLLAVIVGLGVAQVVRLADRRPERDEK
jgi:cytochrome oxidase assembly protein ShyY1